MSGDPFQSGEARDALDDLVAGRFVAWERLTMNPAELIAVCDAREIAPIVYHRFRQRSAETIWPAGAGLESGARAAAARELVRRRAIADVFRALAARMIRPVLIKGVALAYTLYDAPSLRPYADVDSVIRYDQIEPIKRTMRELGYAEALSSPGELLFCQFQMVKRDRFGIEIAFDFHWKISTQTIFAGALTYSELDGAAQPIPALGPFARGAGWIHALLVACIHPVMHHRNARRTIWAYDTHLLASRLSAIELDQFASLAIDRRVAAICGRQLAIAAARFGTSVPDQIFARLQSENAAEPSAAYLSPVREWRHELAANVRGQTRFIDRLRLLREVLFPPPRFIVERYAAFRRLGYLLLPALYLHRGLAGAWKILRHRK